MRLIDADEFLVEASKHLDMQELYLPVHIKDMVIDAMPTVELERIKSKVIVPISETIVSEKKDESDWEIPSFMNKEK